VKAAALLEAVSGRDVPRVEAERAGKAGGWLSAPQVAGRGICLTGAHYSILLKWHLGVALLPVNFAGRPFPLCGGTVDVFGDYAVSCKKSGFGDRQLAHKPFYARSSPTPEFHMTARWKSPKRTPPSERLAEGVKREAGPRSGPGDSPAKPYRWQTPARQRSHFLEKQGKAEESGKCRILWADRRGLLPHGV